MNASDSLSNTKPQNAQKSKHFRSKYRGSNNRNFNMRQSGIPSDDAIGACGFSPHAVPLDVCDMNYNVSDKSKFSNVYHRDNDRYSSKNYSAKYKNYNRNKEFATDSSRRQTESFPESEVENVIDDISQRGQVVSGRYIRKNVNSGRSNSQFQDIENSFSRQTASPSYKSKYSNRQYELHEQSNNFKQSSNYVPVPSYSRKYDQKYESCSSDSDATKLQKKYSKDIEKSVSKKNYDKKSSSLNSLNSPDNKATQREILISHLGKGEYECLVCCELIRTKDFTWHCLSCFHVLHLRCIRKWARSPSAAVEDGSWRCPACQNLSSKIPFDYYCFCGKMKNPEINYHLTPHCCGEICGRIRSECSHPCKELCHPGPCPPCAVVVQKTCSCGKTSRTLPCGQNIEATCQYICDRLLNCGAHKCIRICHEDSCSPCEEYVSQKCYCGKNERSVICTKDTSNCFTYVCGNVCERTLNCGHHTCKLICHSGSCPGCELTPEVIKFCSCGKSRLSELISVGKAEKRLSCTDPIPVCDSVCGKILTCGPKDNHHTCQSTCHTGDCPKCPLVTSLKCRCGAFTKEFPCAELNSSCVYTCEKRCNRRKDCGRHKCLNNCCINYEHKCDLICNKKLSCGLHNCKETCHGGNCPTCWNVSFDELRCHCGTSVLYPPIHCGTKPPECSEPCIRNHECEHEVKHTCHSDEKCPPCTYLVTKWCYGRHKQCGPVMCFLDGISCGMACNKVLPCGRHKCQLSCHSNGCLKESEKCTQPCTTPRVACGHPCGSPCHDGSCPETPCKTQVNLSCPCGHRSEVATCYESAKSFHQFSSTILATKMQEIKDGQSVSLNDMLGKKSRSSRLQCNEECAVLERNKRLAVALQIQNPDLSNSPASTSYSEFLKDEAKKNPQFVADVYDKITSLVQLAQQSKQKCRSYSFPAMNRDRRRVVHELAEFFGCETQSYDEEPKKNVVVTAYKTKCWLPFVSIMTVVQRDMGFRKGPAPILIQKSASTASGTAAPKKKIDYFDYSN